MKQTPPGRMTDKSNASILDACCGSRMFWFDHDNPDVMFVDKRREHHHLKDRSSKHGGRTLIIDPDLVADFKALPFPDEQFQVVVFDPPHLIRQGNTSWLAKKYGKLEPDWKADIKQGFSECFRVLKWGGGGYWSLNGTSETYQYLKSSR